jgi:H+-translocating NAD(P) transhydrogenase subunit alpha
MSDLNLIAKKASQISAESSNLAMKIYELIEKQTIETAGADNFLNLLTVFILSCIVGYYVVWRVTPALHTPLMAVTNAISGIIIIGALMVTGFEDLSMGAAFGLLAIFLSSVNIFGGFVVTYRMLKMFEKK